MYLYIPTKRRPSVLPITFLAVLTLSGCLGMPERVQPVQGFQLQRYLGTWHEIARLDHSFERGLTAVTANYSLRSDGGVRVLNRGFKAEKSVWKEAEGKAYFATDNTATAYLKVSFFGPFYGSYVVFALDDDYQYSFVSGPDTSYLWFLARTPTVPDALKDQFVEQAQSAGFDTSALIWLDSPPSPVTATH